MVLLSLGVSRLIQKLNPLGVTILLLALGDDLPVEQVERGEQGGCAVAFVVVDHGSRALFLQRQFDLVLDHTTPVKQQVW